MLSDLKEVEDLNIDDFIGKTENTTQKTGKRKSLGRGIEALLGDSSFDMEISGGFSSFKTNEIAVSLLYPSPFQPRKDFDEKALSALVESIKEKGVLQPLLVRKQGNKYEIIAGERRFRASKIAGLNTVPVIEKTFTDKEVLEVALVENLLRENLSAIEEGEGFQRLIDEFLHTQEVLSKIVGKSRSYVANTLRLLSLPEDIKNLVRENKLSPGHARNLVGLANASVLAKQIIEKDLSVRQVEELVSKQKAPKKTKSLETKSQNSDIKEIEKDLIEALGMKVKISPDKKGGGKIVLQYASVADLDKVISILEKK